MDLLSAVINKVKSVAASMGKSISDNEGFIQQGRPTLQPIQQAITNWASQPQNYQVANTLANIPQTINTGLSNLKTNIGMIASPQTRTDWFRGFTPQIPQQISQPISNLKQNISLLANPQTRGTFLKGFTPNISPEITQPIQRTADFLTNKNYAAALFRNATPKNPILKWAYNQFIYNPEEKQPFPSGFIADVNRLAKAEEDFKKGKISKKELQDIRFKAYSNPVFALSTPIEPVKKENLRMVSQAVKQGHITAEEGQAILEDLAKQGGKIKIKGETTPPPTTLPVGESGGEVGKIKIKGSVEPQTAENISQFTETVKTSPKTPKKIKEVVENAYYRPTTNVQDIANAQNTLNLLGWDKAKEKLLKEPLTSENSMLGQIMASKAFKEGKFDEGNEIIKNLSLKATKSGQSIQALSVWSKFTPEGMVKFAQKEIENANNSMPLLNKILGKKGEWTAEDSKFITEQMKKINTLTDEAQKTEATRGVFDYISKKLPWGASDLIDEFRYNNMLSNPLTHLRNAINNLQQTFLVRPATLAAEGKPIEAVKYEIGALKSLPDAFDAFKQALRGKETFGKMDVAEIGSQLQKPKRLGAYNLPTNAMEAADKFFSTLIIGGEKARGKGVEEAIKTAEYFLFRQGLKPEQQGVLLNKIDDITRAVYQLRKVGLGWFIPFIRTPMNVAKQWIEYSPAGFLTTIGAANKKEQVAKALLGTLATAIGAELALQDRVTWAAPTDPLQKKLFYDSGRKPYSIKIGDKWIPMQNAGVFAWALGIPAAVKYYTQESREALSDDQITKLTKIMTSIAGFWSNQTFVSGLASFVKLAEGDIDYSLPKNIGYSLGQLKPMEGLMRYVATVIDPVFRKPRTIGEQLISDIPFLTKQLPAYETTLGEPATRNITNYIAPYAWGFENKQFEEPYQQRTKQLQENSLVNKLKNEEEGGLKQVGSKILITSQDGNVKMLDLSKIMPSDTDTNYQKALKQKKAFSYVDEILESNMSVEDQGKALAKLGIDPEDAAYYNVARQPNDIKEVYVRDEIGKYGNNRQEMLNSLLKMRREVNNKPILTSEITKSLYEDGIISYDEKKWLDNASYTKDGQVKVKLTGRGRTAKLKSISYKAKKLSMKVPKLKAVKIGGIRKSAGKSGRGRIFKVRKVSYK
uniref:Large polyvalent protein associated domain-containing protein n=1 Tax=candidate division CPR3 bacterium TaxID=2268181 RepID=A0A7C5URK9_UNCC3